MKNYKQAAAVLIAFSFAHSGFAKTDPKVAIEQLKTNIENSEANYQQYQQNLDVVNKNVAESDKAIKELQKLKTQLINNTKNVDKNKAALLKMEKDVQLMKGKETAKIQAE